MRLENRSSNSTTYGKENSPKLSRNIEIDDTYVGGTKHEKRRRGAIDRQEKSKGKKIAMHGLIPSSQTNLAKRLYFLEMLDISISGENHDFQKTDDFYNPVVSFHNRGFIIGQV